MSRLPAVRILGLHVHIGSQVTSVTPFQRAVKRVLKLKETLAHLGITISRLDLGGGIGITYHRERPPTAAEYARALLPLLTPHRLEITVEPGRYLIGNAGWLITRVLYKKQSHRKRFVIVDAGMNDLIRPSLYDAYHGIVPIRQSSFVNRPWEVVDVVGPVCETGDFLAKDRRLPVTRPGDYLVIFSAGAYGYSMASNYNMRLRPAEVLVQGRMWRVVRRRETYQDLLKGQGSGFHLTSRR